MLLGLMRLYSMVLNVLVRCGVPEGDAPEVAQSVILYAAQRWNKLPIPPDELAGRRRRAYLAKLAFGFAADFHTAERRRAEHALRVAFADVPDVVPTPEDLVLHREADAERAADVALEDLRAATQPEFWTAFYAHEVEGLPVEMISKLEGVPVGTVYNRLRCARRDLRASINRKRAQRRREEQLPSRPRKSLR